MVLHSGSLMLSPRTNPPHWGHMCWLLTLLSGINQLHLHCALYFFLVLLETLKATHITNSYFSCSTFPLWKHFSDFSDFSEIWSCTSPRIHLVLHLTLNLNLHKYLLKLFWGSILISVLLN